MEQHGNDPALVWHEDSAIWEVIAGELLLQHTDPIAGDRDALLAGAAERAADALASFRRGNLDAAGHALIGCSLATALAAKLEGGAEEPMAQYASELAASVSWRAEAPGDESLADLLAQLEERNRSEPGDQTPTLWALAVHAGALAAGLSPHITRRRQRRDLLTDAAA
jgi:hypothetical protein